MVCSYNCAEVGGRNRGVTLATPKRQSPLQAIEKKKFKDIPIEAVPEPFGGGQTFGGNGKLLGLCLAEVATPASTLVPKVASK